LIAVKTITDLHRERVAVWHTQPIDNPYLGFLHIVCQQHSFNFLLWHEEDKARSRDAADSTIAQVKRSIDNFNQQRNDWLERLDESISEMLVQNGVQTGSHIPLNTETPGSAIDRLSIAALRLYHLREQLERNDVSAEHVQNVERKVAVCVLQLDDLQQSLQVLIDDIFAGRRRHRTYRQLKMYNDPALNPYLYQSAQRKVG
jgi:hypothetical protein